MKKFAPLVIVLCFCLLTVGCISSFQITTKNTGEPATKPAATPLDKANQAYQAGRYQEAAGLYNNYLSQTPNPKNLEAILAAYAYSADAAQMRGEAISIYERLVSGFPQGTYSAEGRARLMELYVTEGQMDKVIATAPSYLTAESDGLRQNRLRLSLAQAQWAKNNFKGAVDNFLTVYHKSSGPLQSAAKAGVEAALPNLDVMTVSGLQHQYGQNFPGPEATYVLAWQAAKMSDLPAAKAQGEYFNHYFSSHPLAPKMSQMLAALEAGQASPQMVLGQTYLPQQLDSGPAQPQISGLNQGASNQTALSGVSGAVNIAVILPLSDPSSGKYAGDVLKGLQLALKEAPANLQLGLVVLDSKGQGDVAASLVTQAAGRDDVLAAVGPLVNRESAPAAQAAQAAGLPLIAISQNADLVKIGSNIFRLFLTPKHQAEAVARYAVKTKGHQTLGVLYPQDSYGQSMRRYFEDEVRKNGAQVTQAESYDAKAKNWGDAVTRLTGGSAGRKVAASYQAKTAFTTLYIPAPAGEVSQILPLMAFHDVTRMEYLGTPLWLNKDLLANAGRYLQGSVIPVAVSDLSNRAETKRFIDNWFKAYGSGPDQFGAYGYDAGLALINALAGGAGKRAEIAAVLKSAKISGATGLFGFASNGEYLVDPTLLTISGQEFKLLREPGN